MHEINNESQNQTYVGQHNLWIKALNKGNNTYLSSMRSIQSLGYR